MDICEIRPDLTQCQEPEPTPTPPPSNPLLNLEHTVELAGLRLAQSFSLHSGGDKFYVEILAKPGHRKARPTEAVDTGSSPG